MTDDTRLYVEHRTRRQGWITAARTNSVGKHRFTLHLFGHGTLANVKTDDIRFITADQIARCHGGLTLDYCAPAARCYTCQRVEAEEAAKEAAAAAEREKAKTAPLEEIDSADIEEIERSAGLQ